MRKVFGFIVMLSLLVACGAFMYCLSDSQFALGGLKSYSWVIAYFFLITFEMTYGKKLTSSVKMDSVWGPVLYCNTLAALPMFLLGYLVSSAAVDPLSIIYFL